MDKTNKQNKIGLIARHGDLSYHHLKVKPKGLKEIKHNGSFVLALGEVTGHKHVITAEPDTMRIFKDSEGRYVLELKQDAKISHEEHKTITIPKGLYVQKNEREFDYFSMASRQVQD